MGSWFGRVGDLHIQAPEYSRTIHCKMNFSGTLPGGGAEAGIAGYQEVVIEGGTDIIMPTGEVRGWGVQVRVWGR